MKYILNKLFIYLILLGVYLGHTWSILGVYLEYTWSILGVYLEYTLYSRLMQFLQMGPKPWEHQV
jgi:hypothetical protein